MYSNGVIKFHNCIKHYYINENIYEETMFTLDHCSNTNKILGWTQQTGYTYAVPSD